MPRYQNVCQAYRFCRIAYASALIRAEPNVYSTMDNETPGMLAEARFRHSATYDNINFNQVLKMLEVRLRIGWNVTSEEDYLMRKAY